MGDSFLGVLNGVTFLKNPYPKIGQGWWEAITVKSQ